MRKRTGSVVCPSCGMLVGVNDAECLNCGRKNPGLWGFAPLLRSLTDLNIAPIVIYTCILLYLGMLLYDPRGIQMGGMFSLFSPSSESLFLFGASGAIPVFEYNRWWTPLSATWLHAGLLHILFNMMWIRDLAPAIAHLYGSSRAFIIFTVSGISGFVVSTLMGAFFPFLPRFLAGAQLTIGASASIFGLLGALIYYQRRAPSRLIGMQAGGFAVAMLVFGFIMPGVDNWAHLGGLGGGFLAAMWMNPLAPERGNHTVIAFLCLLASAAAIILSIALGLSLLR
ncbi:MAG: rhomboid family intramembrane serine protease [Acidobacteria bacterium]|nr:MAG: rhomboid family intramembrane serine protease [Acidobacteriota bacterium]